MMEERDVQFITEEKLDFSILSPSDSREDDDDDEPPPGGTNGRWSPLSGAGLEEMVREATRLAAQLQQSHLSPLPPSPGGGSPRSPRRETFVVKDSPVRALLPTVPAANVPKVGGGHHRGVGRGHSGAVGCSLHPCAALIPYYRSPPAVNHHPGEPPAAGGRPARVVPPGPAHPGGLWHGASPSPSVQGQQVMGEVGTGMGTAHPMGYPHHGDTTGNGQKDRGPPTPPFLPAQPKPRSSTATPPTRAPRARATTSTSTAPRSRPPPPSAIPKPPGRAATSGAAPGGRGQPRTSTAAPRGKDGDCLL
uniref:Proline and serine rich coiled-coil 1 n=1 Tax=Coturnix japonica TaxID=93934 RepID=A0A8C2T9R5_COTJA